MPFPPGGGTDALARAIQDPFQKAIGQTVIIDNGRGGGSIGHEIVAKAPPDGYTVRVSSNNQMLLPVPDRPARLRSRRLRAVGFVAKQESVFVGSADAPWKDLAAITEAARKAPGDVQYGTAGISTPMHLSTERYAILNKIKLTHVPFRGTGPLVTDLLGGHVKLGMSSLTSVAAAPAERQAQGLWDGGARARAVGARHQDLQGAGLRRRRRHHRLYADRAARHAGAGRCQAQRGAERLRVDAGDEGGAAQARLRRHGRHARGAGRVDGGAGAGIWGPVLQAAGVKPE